MSSPLRIDIFCAVIDNYGDAGVCWRLARQLAVEKGCGVRLFVDRPEVLRVLVPAWHGDAHEGVQILSWLAAGSTDPADVVIEAFACNPPAVYVAAMRAKQRRPVWINLEYLSAEDWVEGCHALPSPQPDGLQKYFFFPGLTAATGGLIRESALDAERAAFQRSQAAQAAFWRALGIEVIADELRVSLFAYENAAIPALLDIWAAGPQTILCALPVGRALPQAEGWAGQKLSPGDVVQRGALRLAVLPFLPQPDYDRLLWACDLNFVRGEDSFVRAQWARRPFVWHIYQQADDAHTLKLEAFLGKYCADLSGRETAVLRRFWLAWEGGQDVAEAWPDLRAVLTGLSLHAENWAERVAAHGDLASKLLIFCTELIE